MRAALCDSNQKGSVGEVGAGSWVLSVEKDSDGSNKAEEISAKVLTGRGWRFLSTEDRRTNMSDELDWTSLIHTLSNNDGSATE